MSSTAYPLRIVAALAVTNLMLKSTKDAQLLLESLDAPVRLLTHLRLVGEAAEHLVLALEEMGITFKAELVRLGASIHDAGKIVHPAELSGKGNLHELAGEELLLRHGVQSDVARCCVSHARYEAMEVSFEELLVALSDKLWKGKREENLELRVIDEVAMRLGKDRWDVFSDLDSCFERVAADGGSRLSRSKVN